MNPGAWNNVARRFFGSPRDKSCGLVPGKEIQNLFFLNFEFKKGQGESRSAAFSFKAVTLFLSDFKIWS